MTVKLSSCLCLLLVFVASASIYWYCLLFVRFLFILIFLYCKIVIFTVCCFFLCYLMAFDCQELKGLLTYLLTYLQGTSEMAIIRHSACLHRLCDIKSMRSSQRAADCRSRPPSLRLTIDRCLLSHTQSAAAELLRLAQ